MGVKQSKKAKSPPLPDNADGMWRSYYTSNMYHHYKVYDLQWQHQTAECGRVTRTGNGSFSPLRDTDDFYQQVCGKCRQIVSDSVLASPTKGA